MNQNIENTLIGLLMVVTSQLAQADDAPFDAYETVREAGIGTNTPDYDQYDNAGATKHYVAEPSAKSETIYVKGKAVCFKLESNVSVAYYCNN